MATDGPAVELSSAAPPESPDALLCPGCGFDLRATTSDRCGECGLEFNRDALRISGIPWAHRREIGALRAYVKTVWQVTFDSRSLRHESAKPQDLRDARRFRRITAIIVAVTFAMAFAIVVGLEKNLRKFNAILPRDPVISGGSATSSSDRLVDVAVPWLAGVAIIPVLPICLMLFAFALTGAPRYIFRVPAQPPDYRWRAIALGHYAAAPLTFLLPSLLFLGAAPASEVYLPQTLPIGPLLAIVGFTLLLFAVLGTVYRVGTWFARIAHCGFGRAFLAALELLGLWILDAAICVGLLPWCIGLLWIILDSLR